VLCHEYHHLKLFMVEEQHPLLSDPGAPVVAPWRRDLRTARGLLHGIYVFFMVARVFGRLFQTFPPSEAGLRKLLVWRIALEIGIDLLRDRSTWSPTELGSELVDQMAESNRLSLAELEAEHRRLAEWVRSAIVEHVGQAGRPDSREPWFLGL